MAGGFDEYENTEYNNSERVHLFILCDARLKQESDITINVSLQQKRVKTSLIKERNFEDKNVMTVFDQ